MKNNKNVTFRRYKGRIIPIRIKDKKAFEKGIVDTGSGVAIGVGTGILAAKAVKESAEMRVRARTAFNAVHILKRELPKFKGTDFSNTLSEIKNITPKAVSLRNKSRLLFKARNPILAIGAGLASAAISSGAFNFAKSIDKDQKFSDSDFITSSAISAGVGAAVLGVYYRRLGIKNVRSLSKFVRSKSKRLASPSKIKIKTKFGSLDL